MNLEKIKIEGVNGETRCRSNGDVCRCSSRCDCDVIHTDTVEKVKTKMLSDEILIDISDFYKALSDSTRLKIINALNISEMCVCDISALLNMTKSAISHQLKNLKDLNLVKSRRQGKEVYYSLADKHVQIVFEITREHVEEK